MYYDVKKDRKMPGKIYSLIKRLMRTKCLLQPYVITSIWEPGILRPFCEPKWWREEGQLQKAGSFTLLSRWAFLQSPTSGTSTQEDHKCSSLLKPLLVLYLVIGSPKHPNSQTLSVLFVAKTSGESHLQ